MFLFLVFNMLYPLYKVIYLVKTRYDKDLQYDFSDRKEEGTEKDEYLAQWDSLVAGCDACKKCNGDVPATILQSRMWIDNAKYPMRSN